MIRHVKTFALAASFAFCATTAFAYQVTPMIYELKPSGKGATTVVKAHNTNSRPITIELVAEKRSFDERGKESRVSADKDFILFPPQAVIAPGATQALRVQYVGPTDLTKSVMYTVTVKQVPVKLPVDSARGVQFVFNFSTVANVVPDGAKPAVETVSLVPNGQTLRLTLRNAGRRYANLSLSSVALDGGAFNATVDKEAWRKALGSSWLLPDSTRIIDLPKPAGAPATGLTAKLKYVEVTQ